MQNLFRRPSGVYGFRLPVPAHLRPVIGKREVIITTGTTELTIAKLVASSLAAQWRQRFFESDRLLPMASFSPMPHQEILTIARGHPVLLAGGHLQLPHAASASGIKVTDLLRAAGNGRLHLYVRSGPIQGHLVAYEALEPVDAALGRASGVVIPSASSMPASATEHLAEGIFRVESGDMTGVTASLLTGLDTIELGLVELPGIVGKVFVPGDAVRVRLEHLEVEAGEVDALRRSMSSLIEPERLQEAKDHQQASLQTSTVSAGKEPEKLLSVALDAYITHRVRQDVAIESEITRIRNGCNLLIESEGDVPLRDIDTGRLRQFRNGWLSRVPANENKIRLTHGTKSVRESMAKVAGTDWAVMSVSERNKRMQWIGSWFRWMHESEGWIAEDPARPLRGESVLSKAERRKEKSRRRDDEARDQLDQKDLNAIFSAPWFATGRGELSKKDTYRTFMPLYYWLPLLGLYTGGGRINELSQMHISNFQQTDSGQWYLDFNEEEQDQNLKTTPSKRKVPLHSHLLRLGFADWLVALRENGYTRLFPELKHNTEKGYGKAATKWFTSHMASLGIVRDGTKTFHSFRHTYTNALPEDTPARISRQLTGHKRGGDVHDKTYKKDVEPDVAAQYVERLAVSLPAIAKFDI
jgi:integrase